VPSDIAIRGALEAAGVEFIDENGGGPGVRLRSINMAGFEIMRTSSAGELRDLEHYWMMRAFHSRDAREIEGLYRRFLFP